MLVRRTRYLFLCLEEDAVLDITELLRGSVRLTSRSTIHALSILRGEEVDIDTGAVRLLLSVPADKWIPTSRILPSGKGGRRRIEELTHAGLLVSKRRHPLLSELRRRDEVLSTTKWDRYAALYHFMTRWRGAKGAEAWPEPVEVGEGGMRDARVEEFINQYGPPPDHFYEVRGGRKTVSLPLVRKDGPFYQVLLKRQTTRTFDPETPLSREQLTTVLYYVYGCQGRAIATDRRLVWLKKTSPSGGALHPVEVYPLVLNVAGLSPGLYHYNVRDHSLACLEEVGRAQAAELADEFTAGQSYTRAAGALFIMAARFYRNYWKYQLHPKAYKVLLMDVAHLSQTFYLVCAELGLGAFFTAAINGANIDERLGLDPYEHGALGISGCGAILGKNLGWELAPKPYLPRS